MSHQENSFVTILEYCPDGDLAEYVKKKKYLEINQIELNQMIEEKKKLITRTKNKLIGLSARLQKVFNICIPKEFIIEI